MNKKGVFYTLIALTIIGFFLVSFSYSIQYKEAHKFERSEARINTMNDFVNSIEKDLSRALYISSFRSLISLNNFISSNGSFLTDIDAEFYQIMVNGTIKDNPEIEVLMENQTFTNWTRKIEVIAASIGIYADVTLDSLTLSHYDPWTIQTNAIVNITLTDPDNTAEWEYQKAFSTKVSIHGMEDPMYTIYSEGKVARLVVPTNFSGWDIENLTAHFRNKTYIQSNSAPSFLDRMVDNIVPSPFGIETLVDSEELNDYGLTIYNYSHVDWMYWNGTITNTSKIENITRRMDSGDEWEYFTLDLDSINYFNVTGAMY